MNNIIKTVIGACMLLIGGTTPMVSNAGTSIFSGKDAFGSMGESGGSLSLYVNAFQSASQSKSAQTDESGASFSGDYYSDTECWYGNGSATAIQLNIDKQGTVPSKVTASGSIPVTWFDWCGSSDPITEDVTFTMDLTALTDQRYSTTGTNHYDYGSIYKANIHYDYEGAPATANNSLITSPNFGTLAPSAGTVGNSKGFSVEIIH